MNWFDVDKRGLAAILERRGKEFVLYELVQNAWDSGAAEVKVNILHSSRNRVVVTVEDDSPAGFAELTLAFTLFGRSTSAGDAEKRGRFCIGDKLVLALCEEATIRTTTGSVRFDATGRHLSRAATERGSVFSGTLRMTRADADLMVAAADRLLPPPECTTWVNGKRVGARELVTRFVATLPTELADDEGILRVRARIAPVKLYEPKAGEVGTLYELGIPVVETGDRYHVDIGQKVPLNSDRDNVTPSYLRHVRTLVLNAVAEQLTPDEASAGWVRDAAGDERVEPAALARVMELRFGPKRVIADPSDPEGTKLAVAKGYTVVTGGALSADEWHNVRANATMLPAGQVTPSPKPYGAGGIELTYLDEKEWTVEQAAVVGYARRLAQRLLERPIMVHLVRSRAWMAAATYGPGELTINVAKFRGTWWTDLGAVNALLIHEFGHEYSGDHLSEEYHEALCKLGARLAQLALDDPQAVAL
jgi:Histidine kinase-, DNA gyrase B-, and HSP90-like ATPase